jgi:hypothetical protein
MSLDTNLSQDSVGSRLLQVENTLLEMVSKIGKIHDALVGNEKFDQVGLITRLKKLEEDNEKNKALKNRLIGAAAVGGVLWTVLWEGFKHLFLNK